MRFVPPRFLKHLRSLRVAFAALALLVTSRDARAQVVQGITGSVLRVEADGKTSADIAHPHKGGVPLNAINYEDCSANLEYEFDLALSGATDQIQLVAYAGPADCTAAAERAQGTGSCYPVLAQPITGTAPSATLFIRMQDLAAQATNATPNVTYTPANASACTAQHTSGGSSVDIYFFFIDVNGNAIGVAQAYPVTVDTQAAVVNGAIAATGANGSVTISIPASGDPDVTGWNVYCDPPPGQETVLNQVYYDAASNQGVCPVDSGSLQGSTNVGEGGLDGAAEAGEDGASPVSDAAGESSDGEAGTSVPDAASVTQLDDAGGNACGAILNDGGTIPAPGNGCYPSALFSSTEVTVVGSSEGGTRIAGFPQSVIPTKYLCGVAGPNDTSVTIAGLKNGDYYNVAVAATDAVGNVGPLATGCGQPNLVPDFYSDYLAAGGAAGGGYCATDGVGVPAGTGALFLLVVAAGAALVRRRLRAR